MTSAPPAPPAPPAPSAPATADLCDQHSDTIESCDLQFRQFGRRQYASGTITTVRVQDDNLLVSDVLAEAGAGRVLVIDNGGSLHVAMLGGQIGALAVQSGWEAIVINGVLRDSAQLAPLDIVVKALGSNPRRPGRNGGGQRDVTLGFGNAVFSPGKQLVSDGDGVVVLA